MKGRVGCGEDFFFLFSNGYIYNSVSLSLCGVPELAMKDFQTIQDVKET